MPFLSTCPPLLANAQASELAKVFADRSPVYSKPPGAAAGAGAAQAIAQGHAQGHAQPPPPHGQMQVQLQAGGGWSGVHAGQQQPPPPPPPPLLQQQLGGMYVGRSAADAMVSPYSDSTSGQGGVTGSTGAAAGFHPQQYALGQQAVYGGAPQPQQQPQQQQPQPPPPPPPPPPPRPPPPPPPRTPESVFREQAIASISGRSRCIGSAPPPWHAQIARAC